MKKSSHEWAGARIIYADLCFFQTPLKSVESIVHIHPEKKTIGGVVNDVLKVTKGFLRQISIISEDIKCGDSGFVLIVKEIKM